MSKIKKNTPLVAATIENSCEIIELVLKPLQESPNGFNF